MKILFVFFLILFAFSNNRTYSQVNMDANNFMFAQSFSKEIALFNAKSFLIKDVLGSSADILKFEVIPLASASSGELTTLIYNCDSKKKEGIILGFYGDYWNDAGVIYKGFAFKNLDKNQAIEFLDKIQNAIDENAKYLLEDSNNNNICFSYDDIEVLIFRQDIYRIRLLWNKFDSSWENIAFERTKKRFEKNMK